MGVLFEGFVDVNDEGAPLAVATNDNLGPVHVTVRKATDRTWLTLDEAEALVETLLDAIAAGRRHEVDL